MSLSSLWGEDQAIFALRVAVIVGIVGILLIIAAENPLLKTLGIIILAAVVVFLAALFFPVLPV